MKTASEVLVAALLAILVKHYMTGGTPELARYTNYLLTGRGPGAPAATPAAFVTPTGASPTVTVGSPPAITSRPSTGSA